MMKWAMASSSQTLSFNHVLTKGYRIPSLWPGVQLLGQPGRGAFLDQTKRRFSRVLQEKMKSSSAVFYNGFMKTNQKGSNPKKMANAEQVFQ
jgi:hypothetical protein